MTSRPRELLACPRPFFAPRGSRLLFMEPAGSSPAEILKQILEGRYDKPFILDHGALRYLHFNFDRVESLMHRDDPDGLCLIYTRKMMAFLLFNPRPRRILLLGLGGGSLAKFCYRRLPTAKLTVLESDPNVIALREEFRVPVDDERFRVLRGDGIRYVARVRPRKDVILVDAYDPRGIPPGLASAQFYQDAKRRLSRSGILVVNIFGDENERTIHVALIRDVFGGLLILLPVGEHENIIALAFGADVTLSHLHRFEVRARSLKEQFGLDFPRYLRKIASCSVSTL